MKRFIMLIVSFSLLFMLSLFVHYTRIFKIAPKRMQPCLLDSSIHTLVFGPSNVVYNWNDSIISNTKNVGLNGLSILANFNVLEWYCSQYAQIDTVILAFCIPSVVLKYDQELEKDFKSEYPFYVYNQEEQIAMYRNNLDFWKYFITSQCFNSRKVTFYWGGFDTIDTVRINVNCKEVMLRSYHKTRLAFLEQYGDFDTLSAEMLRDVCSHQIKGLRVFADYCRSHDKVLVVLSPPVWDMPLWHSGGGYRRLIREELDDSMLVSDYSSFFPDTTYFADITHLFKKGANLWSQHIADSGLRMQYVIDYCK